MDHVTLASRVKNTENFKYFFYFRTKFNCNSILFLTATLVRKMLYFFIKTLQNLANFRLRNISVLVKGHVLIMLVLFVSGIPIPMAAITIPLCNSQPYWQVTSPCPLSNLSMWVWLMSWDSHPTTNQTPKRASSTRWTTGQISLTLNKQCTVIRLYFSSVQLWQKKLFWGWRWHNDHWD